MATTYWTQGTQVAAPPQTVYQQARAPEGPQYQPPSGVPSTGTPGPAGPQYPPGFNAPPAGTPSHQPPNGQGGMPTGQQPAANGLPKPPTQWQPQGGQAFAQMLQQMFQNYQQPGQFNAPQGAPGAFVPGANPFQTFSGSYTPQSAPGATPTSPFQGANPLDQQTQQAVSGFLQNPNSFGTPAVQQSYNYLSQGIDDQYKQSQAALEEEMARRGLGASSIRGGRLSDLNVANKSAHENLANQLLREQALTGSQGQQAAINAALGYGGQAFGQQLSGYGANMGANAQNFQQQLAQAAFNGDQQAQALMQNMGITGFNNAVGQQGFQNNLAGYQANLAGQGQGFNQALAGYGANQAAGQQGFQNQQQLLQNLLGYEQQGFQNQLGTAQFNAGQNQWYQNLLAQLAQGGR